MCFISNLSIYSRPIFDLFDILVLMSSIFYKNLENEKNNGFMVSNENIEIHETKNEYNNDQTQRKNV